MNDSDDRTPDRDFNLIFFIDRYAPDLRDAILNMVSVQQITRSPEVHSLASHAETEAKIVLQAFSEIGVGAKRLFENLEAAKGRIIVESQTRRRRKRKEMPVVIEEFYDIRLHCVPAMPTGYEQEAPEGAPYKVVGPASPVEWRNAVEHLAHYFSVETQNKTPYTANECGFAPSAVNSRHLILANDSLLDGEPMTVPFGAIGMRWRNWTDRPAGWGMAWVWIHPFKRGNGHLKRAWPLIRNQFSDFIVEGPMKPAMQGFLKQIGYAGPIWDESSLRR